MLQLNILKDFLREAVNENALILDFTKDKYPGKILHRETNLKFNYLPVHSKKDLNNIKDINITIYVIGNSMNLKMVQAMNNNVNIKFLNYRQLKS